MPKVRSLAQAFRDAGYQAYAVGKLHVYPQRDRIGFDDVILDEAGRCQFGVVDDYELFLGDKGFTGQQFDHGMPNDGYSVRPWHLPEETHPTNWATQQMARIVKRRDPGKPAFWYLSYRHPHPPMVPLNHYLDLYSRDEIDAAVTGAWIDEPAAAPYYLRAKLAYQRGMDQRASLEARRAFYALCTHIDHQLRIVLGTLREESLMDRTIVCFIADHGDMLGNHGLWGKLVHYENSANIPMILMSYRGDPRVAVGAIDDRLVGLRDVMPSLLELAEITPPGAMDGLSMVGAEKRDWIYSEMGEGENASRMLHDGRYKLIYYPAGNRRQLFDLQGDPQELNDLAPRPEHGALLVFRLI